MKDWKIKWYYTSPLGAALQDPIWSLEKDLPKITIRDLDEALIEYWASGRIAKLIEMPLGMKHDLQRILREIGAPEFKPNGVFYYDGIPIMTADVFRISDKDIFACAYCGRKKQAEQGNCKACGAIDG